MKRTEVKPLHADITLGLYKLYSKEAQSLQDLADALTSCQQELQQLHHIQLSAKLNPCKIVFSGQDEDSATISFINYPKFPISATEFRTGVEFIAEKLMTRLSQNRIVIEYADSTVMYEESEDLDPKIKL